MLGTIIRSPLALNVAAEEPERSGLLKIASRRISPSSFQPSLVSRLPRRSASRAAIYPRPRRWGNRVSGEDEEFLRALVRTAQRTGIVNKVGGPIGP